MLHMMGSVHCGLGLPLEEEKEMSDKLSASSSEKKSSCEKKPLAQERQEGVEEDVLSATPGSSKSTPESASKSSTRSREKESRLSKSEFKHGSRTEEKKSRSDSTEKKFRSESEKRSKSSASPDKKSKSESMERWSKSEQTESKDKDRAKTSSSASTAPLNEPMHKEPIKLKLSLSQIRKESKIYESIPTTSYISAMSSQTTDDSSDSGTSYETLAESDYYQDKRNRGRLKKNGTTLSSKKKRYIS